jgi:acetoin utilization deacetylase AcuC-like enzyme
LGDSRPRLSTPVVWTDLHRLHEPGGEVWVGVRTPGTEVPERADRIRHRVSDAPIVEARPHSDEAVLAVHDRGLLDYLARAWDEWEAAGLTRDPGQDRVVPYIFPVPALFPAGVGPALPAAASARAGSFAYDTMTLIGPGTWEAARAAVDAALTAADLVLEGERAAYACCRPPGHHATRSAFGGSCYLNNAAAAAAQLRAGIGAKVAVIDIDAHHGNGTQAIFWDDPLVPTGSVHVDPGAGWFPHFLGFAEETGGGANLNVPLAPRSGDEVWLEAVRSLGAWARGGGAEALVVALGVDAAAGDPESPLEVTAAGFRAAGRELGALGLPTVLVQEGGYELETIGGLVREVLLGVEEGREV